MLPYFAQCAIVANVRTEGSIGAFQERTFDLMLDQTVSQDKRLKEAKRILRQIGYETRGVDWEMNPGN
jgi:hypothetical protein